MLVSMEAAHICHRVSVVQKCKYNTNVLNSSKSESIQIIEYVRIIFLVFLIFNVFFFFFFLVNYLNASSAHCLFFCLAV